VETIGDCYVAVAGLPEKRDDHAVVMALFARDCLVAFNRLVKQMEVDLGPDTAGTCYRHVCKADGVLPSVYTLCRLSRSRPITAIPLTDLKLRTGLHSGPVTGKNLSNIGRTKLSRVRV
jgi:class 3 adenylate cyclase